MDLSFYWFTERGFDDMNLDELNENEDDIDEEDEKVFEAYRWVSCLLVFLVNITRFICAVEKQ